MLTIRPVGAQDEAPSLSNAETQFDYAENGGGPITTFRANDPENKPVFWTVGGADAADFTIDGGVLRFKSPPNYEVPTDRHDDTNNDGDVDDGEDPAGNNVYKVTVRFSAGGEDGDPDPTDDYDGDDLGDIDLTINVTNENEDGRVVISPRQPQVGTMLTAILSDEDNVAPGVGEWQWARSDSMTGTFTDIPELSTSMTYRPTIDDLDMYLRVTVVYVDRAGADSRTVHGVSEFAVRKDIVTSNQRPKFPDQSTLVGGDAIVRDDTDRFISETAAAGDRVGAPVTAFDDRTDIEVITYSLRDSDGNTSPNGDESNDDNNPDTPVESDGHAARFNIDEVTGQITVAAGARLNADETPSATDPNPYNVVVRAVDGDGETQDIPVNIAVLQTNEPPTIERVYLTGRIGTGHAVGDRAPTEMSHYEADRDTPDATVIDTNLDTSATVEAATYYANDPDPPEDPPVPLKWSLEGDDGELFSIPADDTVTVGSAATLAFAAGPDFEKPGDKNKDNVYEVTIVVTDNHRLRDTLDVTVKVLNSTDDNKPGEVKFSNRQPEVATALTATFSDPDTPVTQLQWQWFRTSDITTTECAGRTPAADDTDAHRVFLVDLEEDTVGEAPNQVQVEQIAIGGATWIKIAGATSASYTPEANDIDELTDIGKCLRATVTYRDAVDRTHSEPNVSTTDVDETLEGTYAGAEQPVKDIDARNKAPVFREDDYGSARVSVYRADVAENSGATPITEVDAAVDVNTFNDDDPATTDDSVENDEANDLLTYSLSGRDMGAFSIVGTVDNPTPDDAADDGTLTFDGGADFEGQREYRVRITATDPSGDSGFVDVIVNITNVNERPAFTMGDDEVVYMENGTVAVDTYKAADPERSGITYSLVTVAITAADDTDGSGAIAAVEADAFADVARFEIGSISGILSFKESPNFEEARDAGTNNMYQVTVQATVSDNENPRHFATQEVTVIVTDKNEPPVFSPTTDALEITENPDDPNKEPPTAAGYLYLLNRGVGKPSADLPAEPNLDVGIPVVADDDDNNGPDIGPTPLTGISTDRQLTDGLTYDLSGADAGYFHVVPATGQILTEKKLDYESKDEFKVTLKAMDPEGLYDTIDLTISLIDVDEVPVPDILRIAGESSVTYEENDDVAVGTYTVAAGGDATPGAWTLEGADAGSFTLTGSGDSRMLEFRIPPDYDAMADADGDNMYKVTIKVTDSSNSDTYNTFDVTVTVTNVDELGALSGMKDISVDEGDTDVGTYTLSAIASGASYTYLRSLEGDDAGQFTLNAVGTTGVLELSFSSAPDYEMPADADGDNMYMVTVKVEAGGEEETVPVTITVDNVEEDGTIILDTESPVVDGQVTATLSDLDGSISNVAWTWQTSSDMSTWIAATGEATDAGTTSTYMPVEADAGRYLRATASYTDGYGAGNSEMSESAMVVAADVNVAPAFSSETATRSIAENTAANTNIGDPVAATDANGDTLTYSLEGTDAASFGIEGSTGQLSTLAALDFETKPAYSVVVRATDPGGLSDTIDVTINVTDVDEEVPVDPVDTYDTDGTPGISISELFAAIDDYFAGGIINISELFEVIDAYFG